MESRHLAVLGRMLMVGLASSVSGITNTDETPNGSLENKVSPKSIRGNYHAHTTMSDGIYTPEEVVEKAIEAGLAEIGITDHYFTLKGGINFVDDDQIDNYLRKIEDLRQKYGDRIRILAGLEIDTSCFNLKRSRLPFDKLNKLDYVLFEYVEDQGMGEASKQQLVHSYIQQTRAQVTQAIMKQYDLDEEASSQEAVKYMQQTEEVQNQIQVLANRRGVYSLQDLVEVRKKLTCAVGLAHPDIKRNFAHFDADELARTLKENDIFLDACAAARNATPERYDTYGEDWEFTPYFCGMEAFKFAFSKHGVAFAPSTDTHAENNIGDIGKAEAKMNQYHFVKKSF